MDQVDPVASSLHLSAASQASHGSARSEKKQKIRKSFASILHFHSMGLPEDEFIPPQVAGLPLEDAIIKLKDDVDIAGDNLKAGSSMEAFTAYRRAVSDFMRFVVHCNYEVDMQESGRNILRRKRYYILRIVDEKLDHLAADFLVNHYDKLTMLARIDEINGILVDLLT